MHFHGGVRVEIKDGIALVELSNPPVNGLSHDLRKGLIAAIERAGADPGVVTMCIGGAGLFEIF